MDLTSQTTLLSVAALGLAVCASVYVLWGPDNWFRKRGRCPGLANLGNTCFLNAILQALASLPAVKQWLKEALAQHNGRLEQALFATLSVLSEEEDGVHSPIGVLRALIWHRWTINNQQQDAHELYHVLMTTLAEEMENCPSLLTDLNHISVDKKLPGSSGTGSLAWTRAGYISAPERPLVCPLQGMLTSELLCCNCKYSYPMKYECFDSLSLTLPPEATQVTLHSRLLEFTKPEIVHDVECPQCSKVAGVKKKRQFTKRLQLGRPPNSLCIHFNRTTWLSDGTMFKNNAYVTFPLSLDASWLMRRPPPGSGRVKYKLVAVVEHMGGPFSGHYVTYRRCGPTHRQWVYTSDTSVYASRAEDVLNCKAYMLFYCRTADSTSGKSVPISNSIQGFRSLQI